MNAVMEAPRAARTSKKQKTPAITGHLPQQPLSSPESTSSQPPVLPKTQLAVPPAVIPPLTAGQSMDKGRFAFGLLLSSAGVAVMMTIAGGLLYDSGIAERFSLPIVAGAAIMGIMLLGGGFGLMATAAGSMDDGEFERLMEAGNISAVGPDESSAVDKQ